MTTPYCCEQVPDGGAWPRYHRCRNRGVNERDGKRYCNTHDPQKIAAKDAKRQAAFNAEMDARIKKHRLADAAPDLLAACEAALPEIGGHSTMYCNLRDSLCTRCRLRAQLRAAIEKAKG